MEEIMSLLFETNAFKVSDPDHPFWYTSGKLGPYFINADYLYGSQEESNSLLDYINDQLENEEHVNIAPNVFNKVIAQYNSNSIFKKVIDSLIEFIKTKVNLDEVDYVSGGERRDWSFSMMVAHLLQKPHITVFKDVTAVESDYNFEKNSMQADFNGKSVMHVADLLTVASSFVRAWIPAIQDLGGTMKWAVAVVDRNQGGADVLREHNVEPIALFKIDDTLFEKACEIGKINESQMNTLKAFVKDPDGSMKEFLINHPTFVEDTLNGSDAKAAKRAQLLIDGNLYGLN